MAYITIDVEYAVLLAAFVAAVAAHEANQGAWSANNEVRELRHDLYQADVIDESPYAEAYEIGEEDGGDTDGDESQE